MPEHCDVVVIGGGPAGMAAALATSSHGLTTTIIDEQPRPGGQILRQPPSEFRVDRWLEGRAYRDMKAALAKFEAAAGIAWRGQCSVIGIDRQRGAEHFSVRLAGSGGADDVIARRVVVAAGCYDLPVPLPGWTLPGVMSAGSVQAFIKCQQLIPGARFLMAGTHPLMLLIAAQVIEGGGEVACVAFDQPRSKASMALARRPWTALRHSGHLLTAQAAMRVLRRTQVPVLFGTALEAIDGDEVVRGARLSGIGHVSCDRVGLCYGFIPQSDLPRVAGARVEWAEPAGGWRTEHGPWMESNVEGLFVAGETTGVAGANIASMEGRLAGIGVVRAHGGMNEAQARSAARPLRARLAAANSFAAMLAEVADPRKALARAAPPETILCRCEDIAFAKVDALLAEVRDPNAIKLQTRVGMGLCQGRNCEAALLRRIAAIDGSHPAARASFTARYPIRPTRIGDLLDLAAEATKSDRF